MRVGKHRHVYSVQSLASSLLFLRGLFWVKLIPGSFQQILPHQLLLEVEAEEWVKEVEVAKEEDSPQRNATHGIFVRVKSDLSVVEQIQTAHSFFHTQIDMQEELFQHAFFKKLWHKNLPVLLEHKVLLEPAGSCSSFLQRRVNTKQHVVFL
jgi:hypothetical protein